MSDVVSVSIERSLLAAPSIPTPGVDIYSGVARLAATVWASEVKIEGSTPDTAFLFVHPTSNFLGHYALEPLARRGYAGIGLMTRYAGNDSNMRTENCLLDIAALVKLLRGKGYERIILVGNSGGASIAPFYQAQAQHPTITEPPGGGPNLTKIDLPQVDAVCLFMAHSGRPRLINEWLDPAIVDETNPQLRDSALDMYDPQNGPPFSAEFLSGYQAAQVARNRRITAWAKAQLAHLKAHGRPDSDISFVVHGTYADPRILDRSIDPSDRELGVSLWGDPAEANHHPASLGRYTSARSWINQWSVDDANGDALRWLPFLNVPVHVVYGTGDTAAHPGHATDMYAASPPGARKLTPIKGAGHYFKGRPDLIEDACDVLATWAESGFF